ncbi:MAG: ATP-grasp domain-containing protein, partial [Bacteroidia bacterium]
VECAFDPKAHLVDYLFCPAAVKKNMEQQAYKIAESLAQALNLVGVLAVEFFVSTSGELLVNEVAPRTHNSGHHTIEANATSQFEQQWRAILNLPLGDTRLRSPAVMVNLVGAEGYTGTARYQGLDQVLKFQGVYVHLYGKAETRPFRKMGHVTVTDDTLQKAKQKAKIIKTTLRVMH